MNGQATRFCSLWEMWHLQQQSISTEHGKYEGQIWNELLQKAGAPLLTDKKKPQQFYKFHNNKQSKCSYGIEAFQSHSGHQNHGTGQGLYELIWVKVFIFSNFPIRFLQLCKKLFQYLGWGRERKLHLTQNLKNYIVMLVKILLTVAKENIKIHDFQRLKFYV